MGKKQILNEIEDLVKKSNTGSSTKQKKAKGRSLQNWAAEQIRKLTGLPKTDVSPAVMGESGMDVKLSQEARRIFGFSVECKNQEKLNIWQSLEQAEKCGKAENLKPLLLFKRSTSDRYAVLKAEDFFNLITELNELRKENVTLKEEKNV